MLRFFELLGQLILLLLGGPKRPFHLAPEVRLGLEFIVGAPNAFFGHEDLLGNLHKTTRGLHLKNARKFKKIKKGKQVETQMKLHSPSQGLFLET